MSGITETTTCSTTASVIDQTESMSLTELDGLWDQLVEILHKTRNIQDASLQHVTLPQSSSIPTLLSTFAEHLSRLSKKAEAEAILHVREKSLDSPNFGGLGLSDFKRPSEADVDEVLFLVEAWLESVNSNEKTNTFDIVKVRSPKTRPMTLAQKIFAQHCVGGCKEEGLQAGDVVRVSVDWILASELSWQVRVESL